MDKRLWVALGCGVAAFTLCAMALTAVVTVLVVGRAGPRSGSERVGPAVSGRGGEASPERSPLGEGQKLVGRWEYQDKHGSLLVEFKPNGRFSGSSKLGVDTGTWK